MNFEHVLEALFYTAVICLLVYLCIALPVRTALKKKLNIKAGRHEKTLFVDLPVEERRSLRGVTMLTTLFGTVFIVPVLLFTVWIPDFANEDADRAAEAAARDEMVAAIDADIGDMDGVRLLSLRIDEGVLKV